MNPIKIFKKNTFAAMFLIITAALFGLFLVSGLRQGPDFDSSTVLEVQLDHEESLERVQAVADTIFKSSSAEQNGSSRYKLYYQNIESSKLSEVETRLSEEFGSIAEKAVYTNYPVQTVLVSKQALLTYAAPVYFILFIYSLILLRKASFSRLEVFKLVVAQLMVYLWAAAFHLGLFTLIGQFGVVLNNWSAVIMMLTVTYYFLISNFFLIRYKDFRIKNTHGELAENWLKFIDEDWPTIIFATTVSWMLLAMPFIAFVSPLSIAFALLTGTAFSVLIAQLSLHLFLLRLLDLLFAKTGLGGSKFFAKKW